MTFSSFDMLLQTGAMLYMASYILCNALRSCQDGPVDGVCRAKAVSMTSNYLYF